MNKLPFVLWLLGWPTLWQWSGDFDKPTSTTAAFFFSTWVGIAILAYQKGEP